MKKSCISTGVPRTISTYQVAISASQPGAKTRVTARMRPSEMAITIATMETSIVTRAPFAKSGIASQYLSMRFCIVRLGLWASAHSL